MAQSQAIHTFVLGTKELDGKTAEFQYDCGSYSIFDLIGEERRLVYKSKNAQEAYMKWNVYIGRKKERPQRQNQQENSPQNVVENTQKKPEASRKSSASERNSDSVSGGKNHEKGSGTSQRHHSNHSNRTRRESVKNFSDDEQTAETAAEHSGNNYRRDRYRKRKQYSRENSNE